MAIQEDKRDNGAMEVNITETLRTVDPEDLHKYLTENWSNIQVETASSGKKIVREVHGENKTGDFLVTVGPLLVENHGGTELLADQFVRWMVEEKGFSPQNTAGELSVRDAVQLLESEQLSTDGNPVVRLLRTSETGFPACFEFYGGSRSPSMKKISEIGNMSSITSEIKAEYRQQVFRLTNPFFPRGTTEARGLMKAEGITGKERLSDDCLASLITFVGYEELLTYLGIVQKNILLELDGAVGTTQAFVTALVLAEQANKDRFQNRPLVVRVGAPAFGLGNEKLGLNYIMNTQPDMQSVYGWLACGDFGTIMSEGKEKHLQTSVTLFGNGNPSYETVFFLNGGGPMLEMAQRQYGERMKPINGMFTVVRAARVGGEKDWGALFTLPEVLPNIKRGLAIAYNSALFRQ